MQYILGNICLHIFRKIYRNDNTILCSFIITYHIEIPYSTLFNTFVLCLIYRKETELEINTT